MDYKLLLKTILKYKKQSIIVVDRLGDIVYLNDLNGELFETDPRYAIGKNVLDIFGGIDKDESTLYRVLTQKTPIINHIQTLYTFKGKKVTSITTTLPMIDEAGNVVGALEILEDINDYKKLSRTIIQSKDLTASEYDNEGYRSNGTIFTLNDIIGESESVRELKKKIYKVADSTASILIYGETGTGKELVAQSIHNASFKRRKGPFIAQNCAAIPNTLLESILFGTSAGSFTGAKDKLGLFELADGGTLLLDEINSMDVNLQAKLLRVLQEGRIRRVGSEKTIAVDVRIIASTNVSPLDAVEKGDMRRDLYYRLNVVGLNLTPLRERREDIPLLTMYFIETYNKTMSKEIKGVSEHCKDIFEAYRWPGNVRELKYTIENIVNFLDDNWITVDELPEQILSTHCERKQDTIDKVSENKKELDNERGDEDGFEPLNTTVERLERELIIKALIRTKGNKSKAAELLEIPRQSLNNKIKKLHLTEKYEIK